MRFQVGDRVEVDLVDPDDPDGRYDGEPGEVIEVLQDDLGQVTGDPDDSYLYRISFDDASLGTMTFRHADLARP